MGVVYWGGYFLGNIIRILFFFNSFLIKEIGKGWRGMLLIKCSLLNELFLWVIGF